jgi:tripartite-type tricarboxylate transporter receptor subunit TctC
MIRACVLLLAAWLFAGTALGQGYPNRPIRFILPFGVGGLADINARALSQALSQSMGQQVVVENRPGGAYIVGTEMAKRAAPDGHTMVWIGSGHAVSVSQFKSLPYDLVKDFAPVSTVGSYSLALVVKGTSSIKSVSQLVTTAKADPNKFNIAITVVGGSQHLSAELFKSMTGLQTPTVPFKTSPSIFTGLLAGEAQSAFEFLAPLSPHIKKGTLLALGVSSTKRHRGFPNIPTLSEAGVTGYDFDTWGGIAMPARTPEPIIARMNREVRAALATPDVVRRFEQLEIDARPSTPEEMRQLLVSDIAKFKAISEKAGIEKQ